MPGIDNKADFKASLERLYGLDISVVYPGHGEAFAMKSFESS
jgi:glyoxylase-like metal-dependent hydrolase (beta-lactamase superfamily II)